MGLLFIYVNKGVKDMNRDITLSIVMMMKNEEKYLDNTLKALIPVMNEISSEIIILDTGSIDSSVEIAKKYTDKVYVHKWNNDFAYMRNISLSYAKGKWILVLDADEELMEYNNLIDFFKSNLHEKYNSASIQLKNIHSEDEKKYSMASLVRLFKNYKGFRYEGAIHEQPIYLSPTYTSIAVFKHFGYLFANEEIRQLKDKRNKDILIKEIEKSPDNPYINYQLGKQYMISNEFDDALFYMETSYKIYSKLNKIPTFVYIDLACLYIQLNRLKKCVNLCEGYIKKDKFNIDMYYYLGVSQMSLGQLEESISSFKRYIYLLNNYDISTQAKDIQCYGNTVGNKEECELSLINTYYKLEMYTNVILQFDESIDNKQKNSETYFMLIDSLYKSNRLNEIRNYYEKLSSTEVEKKQFLFAVEKLSLRMNKNSVEALYRELQQIEGNYGKLNKIRLGDKGENCKYILAVEKESYYGDILYYCMKNQNNIMELLKDIEEVYLQEYINYVSIYRKDIVLELFYYLMEEPVCLNIDKLKINKCISKALLFNGGLVGSKYRDLFYILKANTELLIREIYNHNFNDESIINYISNSDERFILKLRITEKLKDINNIEYIRKIKGLLLEYPQYKKGIQILIDKFQEEINANSEFKQLKVQYKSIIEQNINLGKLQEAEKMIKEYEAMCNEDDVEILNMKFIISLFNNNLDKAKESINKAIILDINNFNTVFNMAYFNEVLGNNEEALRFYKKIVRECEDSQIVSEANEKIQVIEQNIKCLQGA